MVKRITKALPLSMREESPRDPLVYVVVIATMLAVALAASLVPARRAAAVDPNTALRAE